MVVLIHMRAPTLTNMATAPAVPPRAAAAADLFITSLKVMGSSLSVDIVGGGRTGEGFLGGVRGDGSKGEQGRGEFEFVEGRIRVRLNRAMCLNVVSIGGVLSGYWAEGKILAMPVAWMVATRVTRPARSGDTCVRAMKGGSKVFLRRIRQKTTWAPHQQKFKG